MQIEGLGDKNRFKKLLFLTEVISHGKHGIHGTAFILSTCVHCLER